ncbi:hypothetical protein N7492_009499 [Penicillium capsulatum]|uniref:BZIP domain-containing protein n=1 Tax=Penicillium capsulatum TaxID=69766 RepID=A0A9W9HVF2_9EURO|nr:hypothetical protein N7492_009499 [Penicillium capsulatum]KAJ6106889.1 hypothetical protein N7512_010406 [Penicillium capsulatum]
MATLLDSSHLDPIYRSDPKFTISPSVIDSHPLLHALGLPGDGQPLFPPLPQKSPPAQDLATRTNTTTHRDTKRSRRSSKAQSSSDEINPQRAKHLERNRIAANKCRLKKKKEHEQIQSTLHDESARRDSLLAEVGSLREEIWVLKNQVFSHVGCQDHRINSQLARMTQSALQTSPQQAPCPSPTFSMSTKSDGSSGIELAHGAASTDNAPEEVINDDDFEPLFDKFIEAGSI